MVARWDLRAKLYACSPEQMHFLHLFFFDLFSTAFQYEAPVKKEVEVFLRKAM